MTIYKVHELQTSEWKGFKGVANLEHVIHQYVREGWSLKQVTEVSRPGAFSKDAKSILIIFEKEAPTN